MGQPPLVFLSYNSTRPNWKPVWLLVWIENQCFGYRDVLPQRDAQYILIIYWSIRWTQSAFVTVSCSHTIGWCHAVTQSAFVTVSRSHTISLRHSVMQSHNRPSSLCHAVTQSAFIAVQSYCLSSKQIRMIRLADGRKLHWPLLCIYKSMFLLKMYFLWRKFPYSF